MDWEEFFASVASFMSSCERILFTRPTSDLIKNTVRRCDLYSRVSHHIFAQVQNVLAHDEHGRLLDLLSRLIVTIQEVRQEWENQEAEDDKLVIIIIGYTPCIHEWIWRNDNTQSFYCNELTSVWKEGFI